MATATEAFQNGMANYQAGRLDEAERQFQLALAANAQDLNVLHMLGLLEFQRGRHELAVSWIQRALGIDGTQAAFHNNLGEIYRLWGKPSEAEACYRRALALQPNMIDTHRGLAIVLQSQEKLDPAIEGYLTVLKLKPDDVHALCNVGGLLHACDRIEEARVYYDRALALDPGNTITQFNLATALMNQGHLDEALSRVERFLQVNPKEVKLHMMQGMLLHLQARYREAAAAYQRAIAVEPNFADAHYKLGLSQLALGDFQNGWREFEWRLKTQFAGRSFPQPRWTGGELNGQRILVHSEWGLGDTMQFVRYVPWVQAQGGQVVLAVKSALIPLFQQAGFAEVVPVEGDVFPRCDWQVPLLSLPMIFNTTLETVPAPIPYLRPERSLLNAWREQLARIEGFKIGIQWRGLQRDMPEYRTIPLSCFEKLAQLPGVTLISLQRPSEATELAAPGRPFRIVEPSGDFDGAHGAFMDSAAVMKVVDLVITCDTSTAHLAGALGVPVWVALPKVAEWRWMATRQDSPWYPTMRLFRQREVNDWSGVFRRMTSEVARQLSLQTAPV